ncbi:hypothetical protein DCO48_06840 [Pseudomonas sp. SDI]|uniref:DUF6515 family protein n=1 Tax=Pseudomonas sp. SDI TaxID=2170734 RepID=UPI000DE703AB|nr:DUF6515 family protein [Pseudomonas sp. SDI]PWB34411.1 hypothetical protein DCO48_06840 [Pseudomonas sp. SDI]
MKSRIWHLAGVGLFCMSMGVLAQGEQGAAASPLQSKPDEVRQTQEPRQGYYQDIPRGNPNGRNPHWQAGGPGQRPGDSNWQGRPDGHGNGWGPGPQYRPGHQIDRFPEQSWRVPYRGNDYFYSGGYWYRPQGSRYVVVTPPYGVRVGYLPNYAREVWIGNALFFLAAGTYYQYLNDSREYVVVNPPVAPVPPPVNSGYDVIAYPAYGQGPQQVEQDRYACYRWAVEQTGFDPAAATYAPAPQVLDNYRRALGACLGGRGYSVQ